jgi:hypothetical protein
MAETSVRLDSECWVASRRPPEGYHPVPRGKPGKLGRRWGGMLPPGTPGGRAVPGRWDATQHNMQDP